MNTSDFSKTELEALPRLLTYWVTHWDWECHLLFGLEQRDFQALLESLPECLDEQEQKAELAIIGALREFLHGATAVNTDAVQALIGISHPEASALLNRLLPPA